MKAAAVDYVRPNSLGEALSLLSQGGAEARVIAGGQSLLPMMNLRIAAPSLLIDISRLSELAGAAEDADAVILGAAVTHAMIEDGRVADPSAGLMPRAAAGLAYRAIRNLGTLGGSLALADPAGEWPTVLAALDAELRLRGPNGVRLLKSAEFGTGIFETRAMPDEVIESVRITKLSPGARWGYVKLSRKSGEFAHALVAAVTDREHGYARIVLGAANGAPLVLTETSQTIATGAPDAASIEAAIAVDLDRAADRGFDDYQRNLHAVAAMRAVREAMA
jgi:carbon-monoxide dehydrogenase medium subunit